MKTKHRKTKSGTLHLLRIGVQVSRPSVPLSQRAKLVFVTGTLQRDTSPPIGSKCPAKHPGGKHRWMMGLRAAGTLQPRPENGGSCELVGHRQTFELLTIGIAIEHEIVGPYLVRPAHRRHRPPP